MATWETLHLRVTIIFDFFFFFYQAIFVSTNLMVKINGIIEVASKQTKDPALSQIYVHKYLCPIVY